MTPKRDTGHEPPRGLGPEDLALWRKATARDQPLAEREAPEPAPEAPARPRRATPAAPAVAAREPDLPDIAVGRAPGLDKRSAQRLKRGQLAVEDSIDLHGMTQREAHRALTRFIAGAQADGKRSVLVITGKGLRPDGATGVLRDMAPRWLNEPPNRARVLALHTAQPKHGGAGAYYVLLKRQRGGNED